MRGAFVRSRREFLIGLGGALLGGTAAASRTSAEAAWMRLLGEALGGAESAREIGRAYLRAAPGDDSRERLDRALRAELGGPMPSVAELRDRLAARSRRDFAEGRAVSVDGWRLAHSEARACALVALS